ncbi:MAG TPA: DUF2911 domain-containing protein [Longimicrobium sp.]|nr:DUF2911 domain-containing protein [Longimicrobium sp.]
MRPIVNSFPRRSLAALLLAMALAACAGPGSPPEVIPGPVSVNVPVTDSLPEEYAGLVTVLGNDTLAIERWARTPGRVVAEAVVRAPRTTLRRYVLELAPDGTMRRFEERIFDPAAPDGRPLRAEVFEATAAGWTRTVIEGDSTRTVQVQAGAAALPFVDLVHWPFELVLERAVRQNPGTQPLLSGGRAMDFRVEPIGADQWRLTHPLRGPSVARVDAQGHLLWLDAAGTTRKVVVTRTGYTELEDVARRWAAADRAGQGLGELSGRGRAEANVAGAAIVVDYGTPSKRGRQIFGGVVPWGQVWRTGANRATHFSTSRTLHVGGGGAFLVVPPGEYTLFSVPEPSGGWLIINEQTGQNGTSYDRSRDLGRVQLQRRDLAEPVERFTIAVEPAGGQGGVLRLSWDRTELSVPFTVQ